MKIGIGLPGNIPGTEGDFILEWARRADAGSFSTLGAISNGRLTLGFGVGRRPDDYKAAPAQYNNRGHRLEEQITTMRRIWKGEDVDPESDVCPMGPAPVQKGGPEILNYGGTLQGGHSRVDPFPEILS